MCLADLLSLSCVVDSCMNLREKILTSLMGMIFTQSFQPSMSLLHNNYKVLTKEILYKKSVNST